MRNTSKPAVFFAFLICAFFGSCKTKHSNAEVQKAMENYDRLLQKMDADSLSLMYVKDGKLGEMAQGRDSIRRFLSSFKNVKVLSQVSRTDVLQISGDSSIQEGTYNQSDVIDQKDTIHVKGKFVVVWNWTSQDGWLIKSMQTMPLN
jgi:ketosteroid isomerase-like protein